MTTPRKRAPKPPTFKDEARQTLSESVKSFQGAVATPTPDVGVAAVHQYLAGRPCRSSRRVLAERRHAAQVAAGGSEDLDWMSRQILDGGMT